jgi:transcriptional regulator of acetoin/glycerol metabolism
VDFRLIASAQEDLAMRLGAGLLRLDFYQRVAAGVLVILPPLAERRVDIVPLAAHFARLRDCVLERGVGAVLLRYAWPGNVRELRAVIARAGLLSDDGRILPEHAAEAITLGIPRGPTHLDARAKELISQCEAHEWDVSNAARALGIHRATLYRRLRSAGVALSVARHGAIGRATVARQSAKSQQVMASDSA